MLNNKFKNRILSLVLSLLATLSATVYLAQNTTAECAPCSTSNSEQSTIHGFSLKKTLYFEGHPILQYQHEKSGMWVIVEKNNDIDKKFEISVRTPPENDKGTNHIIEHCVLNGSREYPCKNMLWELSKAAHATLINAFTYPAYTTYPVSSTDEDELESLAKIYTSGVFHPLFLEDERIFKKEGIRYELNEKGNLQANGTVFNEMQTNNGIFEGFIKRMFPDTQGKNLSGGIPEKIMDLSYSELCATYKKYYHPSNMMLRLTGNINYERFLKWLDEEYLSSYEKGNSSSVQYLHQNHKNLKKYDLSYYYKKNTDKDIIDISVSYIIDPKTYKENSEKLSTLQSIINDSNSPRSKFLKEKGYLDVSMNLGDTFYDPVVVIDLLTEDLELSSRECIEETLDELFDGYPVSQEEINQVINEEDFNDTLVENTKLYENHIDSNNFIMSFVRFNDPCSLNYFNVDEKGNITGEPESRNISEKSIHKMIGDILPKSNRIITIFLPTDNTELSPLAKINQKLKSIEPLKEKLTQNYHEQKQWAESQNSPENVRMIKNMLKKLSDINTPNFQCPVDITSADNKNYYQSIQEIGDFISYKFIFKVNQLSDDDKKYWEILTNSFVCGDTKNYSRDELEKEKSGKSTVKLFFKIDENDTNEKNAFIILNVVSQKNDIKKAIELLKEQVNNMNFRDKKSLKEFLKIKTSMYDSTPKALLKFQDLVIAKNLYVENYLDGNQTEEEKKEFYKELYSEIDNNEFLDAFEQKAENIKNKVFNQNALQGIGICASKDNQDTAKLNAQDFITSLSNQKIVCDARLSFDTPKKENIAFIEPSQSNNEVICIIDSKELSHDINFNSTCKLLNSLFLMPIIREKNGAYGAGIMTYPDNDKIILNSIKDPNVSSTVDVFRAIPQFIKDHNFDNEEIESISKSFLGSLFQKNKLHLAENQTEKAVCQQTDHCDLLNKNIQKIKNMSQKEIKHHGEILESLMDNMRIYVISGKLQESDKKLFDTIIE